LGLIVSLIIVRRPSFSTEDSPTKTWNRFSATGATALVIALMLADGSPAQPIQDALGGDSDGSKTANDLVAGAGAEPSKAGTSIHRVLIPADASRQIVGGMRYVDEHFLRELYALAGDGHAASTWLVIDAKCEGELVERTKPRMVVAGQWEWVFEIEILARDTAIVLPLRRDDANWQTSALLDGLPVAIQWHSDGHSCELKIAEPGRYSLAIGFTPLIQRAGDRSQIELSVAEVPGARFRLRHPAGIAGLELSGVAVTTKPAGSTNSLEAELDGSGRLVAHWLEQPQLESESAAPRVTELQWLHVGQDRVELYAKFILEGGARRPEALSVAIDEPWKLIGEGVTSEDPGQGGKQGTIRVPLPPDDIDRQEVLLRWEFDEDRTLGLIRLPQIKLESLPVAQRWIAVSSDPALACEFVGASKAALGTAEEFLARWSESVDTENVVSVVANAAADRASAVMVRPRLVQPTIDEALLVSVGSEDLRLQYKAEVNPGTMPQFQTTIFVTDEVHIDSVTVMRDGQDVPVRWSRADNGEANIFFSEAIVEPYRLSVDGHVPAEPAGTYKVPRVTLESESSGQLMQLYRDDQVLFDVRGFSTTDQSANSTVDTPTTQDNARFVGAYQLNPSSFTAGRLVVTPNNIRISGKTLTAIERDSDAWWANFICRFVVEQGELGSLRLHAPATWSGPIELQSDAPAAVESSDSGAHERSFVVRFSDPIMAGKECEVRLRGRLAGDAASLVAVPDIALDTAFLGRHYVVVPTSLDSQPIAWTERGVQSTELLMEFKANLPNTTTNSAFEITTRPIHMVLQSLPVNSAGTVRLADTLVTIGPFGGQLSVTRMVVVPRGASECELELPPNHELVQVLSDDRPALTRRLENGRWAVPLGAANMPQFLEIVARISDTSLRSDGRLELFRPILFQDGKAIPVEVSLWSVGFPSRFPQPAIEGAAVVSAMEQAALRLDRLTSIAESATRSAIDLPLADGKNWYLPWSERLSALQRSSLETIRQASRSDVSVLHVQSAAQEQLTDAAERVVAWLEQCDQIWSLPERLPPDPMSAMPVQLSTWELAQAVAGGWAYCVADGDAARLVVSGLPSSVKQRQAQLGGLVAIFAIAASTIAIMRWPAGREFFCRWPHAIAFVMGLAYWAFLWPSVLGLLIAAGSTWLALRPGWPGQSMRVEGSTVIRREHGTRSREQGAMGRE
jgi:hypothetical protein